MQPDIETPGSMDAEFSKELLTIVHEAPILQFESTAEPDTWDVESTITPCPYQLFSAADFPRTQAWFSIDV